MKYYKIVITIAVVTFMAGFVGWHIMWMSEVGENNATGPELIEAIQEVRASKIDAGGRGVTEEDAVQVVEKVNGVKKEKQALEQKEGQDTVNITPPAQPARSVHEKQPVQESMARAGIPKIEMEVQPREPKPDAEGTTIEVKDKTMSVTIKNSSPTKSARRKTARRWVTPAGTKPAIVNNEITPNLNTHPSSSMP